MKTIPISELDRSVDILLASGITGPVELTRAGESVGYYFTHDDVARLQVQLEDSIWGDAAEKALTGGMASKERVKALMERFPDAGA